MAMKRRGRGGAKGKAWSGGAHGRSGDANGRRRRANGRRRRANGESRSVKGKGRRAGAGARRQLKTRVLSAKGRKLSSTRWLMRQLNDPYVKAAREAGWRSRAAFKLAEIDDRHRLLRPGMCVIDLGAAPGGWSVVLAERVHAAKGPPQRRGRVLALDLAEMEPVPGVAFLQMDFLADEAPQCLRALLEGRAVDGVVSDMAAPATGHRQTDHLRIMALAEAALAFARQVLRPGGFFLAKVLQGGTEAGLLAEMKGAFACVRHVKPEASRKDSAELYVLATGFRGGPDAGPTPGAPKWTAAR